MQVPGYHFYSPGIAANDKGDAVLAFSGSNVNGFVGSYFAGHYRTDPPNTTNGNKIWQFKSGEACSLEARQASQVI
jgi:hypothetical protein